MKDVIRIKKLLMGFAGAVFALTVMIAFFTVSAHAETGTVYSCTINRSYSNPVTGEVEDSGGESSYATGQGMVEGAVYASGLMEVTDSGNYYLTIRMSLIDYTSNQSFSVQNVGDSGWSGTGIAVTGNGSDNNGTTSDICMQVPSENCLIRVSMYVSPMGRDVVFYIYPSDYSEGNSVGMNPAFVTETESQDESSEGMENSTLDTGSTQETGDAEISQEQDTGNVDETEGTAQDGSVEKNDNADNASETEKTTDKTEDNTAEKEAAGSNADAMNSGNTVASAASAQTAAAKNSTGDSDTDQQLNSAQGLSLSTAEKTDGTGETGGTSGSVKINTVFAVALAVTGSGLVLILATALIIWYFRKNWRRWGGEDDDDEEY